MSQSRSNPRDTPRRTPLQTRSYLNMPHGLHQSPNNSGTHTPQYMHDTNSQASDDVGVIYGTNISMKQVLNALERFILDFSSTKLQEGEPVTELIYRNQLNQLQLHEKYIFEVQGIHLKDYDRQLYFQFIYFPAEMIYFFDYVLKNLYEKYFIENSHSQAQKGDREQRKDKLMIGIKQLDQITQIKSLGPGNINRLVCIRGIVIRSSQVYPQMKRAFFRCTNCQNDVTIAVDNAKVQEPTDCPVCKTRNSYQIIHNLCQFTDKQYVKFQELPEYVSEGETPHSLTILCYDSNVDGIRPGDRVEVVGIYRAQSAKIQRSKANVKSVFNTYIDLISFRILEQNRFRSEDGGNKSKFEDDEKNQFKRMSQKPSIINDLVNSFAPSIYGHEDVKKGILAQLFSGTNKDFNTIGRGHFRSDINICLVGDPSTAKSQMLQQVYKIAPRGIYTSGRGSSAVGLTANVRKDPETHEFILESGALVLSDLGICCIDEFDKMDQNSRTILLEAMQQQTISIAKAGIVCQLNSRTSILAAANPVNSKYDRKKSVVQNINLPPALLSRFDLIYIMLDVPNQASDKLLASHILDIYSNRPGVYRKQLLAKYISYARDYVRPYLSQEAGRRLSRAYLQMRQLGNNKKTITATPRQLESLIRLSQAFAKMRLSNTVTVQDVQEGINLIKVATQQAATDPVTGLIDMDIITTGRTAATKQRIAQIAMQVKDILRANQSKYTRSTHVQNFLLEFMKHHGETEKITTSQMLEALRVLHTEDILVLYGQNKNSQSFKLQKQIGNI